MIDNYVLPALLAILPFVPIVFAITLHETAHGYAALALGDTTARDQGRLTLNPLAHIDRMGTIILPLIQLLTIHRVVFGWARPVPVSAWKFGNPRRGMAIVAVAGPAMNFFLAWLTALAVRGLADANTGAWLYTILIVAGAGVILMPNIPLVKISILSQVVNGVVLPFVLVFMLLLVNKKELMGEYVNSPLYNVIAWATTVVMVGLTLAWFWTLRGGSG